MSRCKLALRTCACNPLSFNQQPKPVCSLLLAVNFYCHPLFVCLCQAHAEPHPISSHITPASTSTSTHTLSLSLPPVQPHPYPHAHTHTHTLSLSHQARVEPIPPLSLPPFAPPASPSGTRTCIGREPPLKLVGRLTIYLSVG